MNRDEIEIGQIVIRKSDSRKIIVHKKGIEFRNKTDNKNQILQCVYIENVSLKTSSYTPLELETFQEKHKPINENIKVGDFVELITGEGEFEVIKKIPFIKGSCFQCENYITKELHKLNSKLLKIKTKNLF
jgi:hypothetical protein